MSKRQKRADRTFRIQAVMSMTSDVTHVEQRALLNAAEDAHIGKVFMMEEGLAAAFGAGVLPTDKRASAIVDIGAGTTNIAIVAKGTVVHSTSDRYGSNAINESLATHLRRHRGLQVGEETTELLKTKFASTFLPGDISRSIEVRGRDVQTGSPGSGRDHRGRGLSDRREHRSPHRSSRQGHAHRTCVPKSPPTSTTAASSSPAAAPCSRASINICVDSSNLPVIGRRRTALRHRQRPRQNVRRRKTSRTRRPQRTRRLPKRRDSVRSLSQN